MKMPVKLIDCDVHSILSSHELLLPYLKEPWRSMIASRGLHMAGGTYASPIGVMRKDTVPPGGGGPGTDPEFIVEQLVKPYNMEYIILTGGDVFH